MNRSQGLQKCFQKVGTKWKVWAPLWWYSFGCPYPSSHFDQPGRCSRVGCRLWHGSLVLRRILSSRLGSTLVRMSEQNLPDKQPRHSPHQLSILITAWTYPLFWNKASPPSLGSPLTSPSKLLVLLQFALLQYLLGHQQILLYLLIESQTNIQMCTLIKYPQREAPRRTTRMATRIQLDVVCTVAWMRLE
jgi:hypothetical protein